MVLYPNFQWGEKVRFASPLRTAMKVKLLKKLGPENLHEHIFAQGPI